jgi:hypothetical protein
MSKLLALYLWFWAPATADPTASVWAIESEHSSMRACLVAADEARELIGAREDITVRCEIILDGDADD